MCWVLQKGTEEKNWQREREEYVSNKKKLDEAKCVCVPVVRIPCMGDARRDKASSSTR